MDGKQADVTFRDELAKAPIKHFDSTLETIDRLAQNNKLYIVTNGVTDTQKRRIAQLQFKDIFDGVFISEETGYQKPMIEFLIMFLKKLVRTNENLPLLLVIH